MTLLNNDWPAEYCRISRVYSGNLTVWQAFLGILLPNCCKKCNCVCDNFDLQIIQVIIFVKVKLTKRRFDGKILSKSTNSRCLQ